jgi:probable phosphoglycerate mutase
VSGPASAGSPSPLTGLAARLVLVRHGESTFVAEGRVQGRLDPPLSAAGERQAVLVASWLAGRDGATGLGLVGPARGVIHSPLRRAAHTARLIADAQQPAPPLVAEDDLAEIGQGDWEGHTVAEVRERWGDLLAAWHRQPTSASAPGGEPRAVADHRVRDGLARIAGLLSGDGPGQPWAVIVAHDGILRLLVLALLDLPLERFWSFPFRLGGVTLVELRAGRAQLLAHNLAGHLVELDTSPPRDGAL